MLAKNSVKTKAIDEKTGEAIQAFLIFGTPIPLWGKTWGASRSCSLRVFSLLL